MCDESAREKVIKQTTRRMVKMGFKANQKGYRYLREAVWIAYSRPETLNSVTKLLYPEIAKLFSTTDTQVEGAIRNTIETVWTKGEQETLKVFFSDIYGDGGTRPTNKEVIERFVERIRNTTEPENELGG